MERERIKRRLSEDCKLVVIDPRRIGITKLAHLWIKPRPGSDPVLAFGLLKVLIEEGLYDKEFIDKWTVGFDELRKEVEQFTLDDVERVTWVSKEHILQIARWFGTIKPGVIRVGMGAFGQGWAGFQGGRILEIMRTIVGGKNLPGWGMRMTPAPMVPGGMMYLLDKFPRIVEKNLSKEHAYALRTAYIADQDLINGILKDKIKACFLVQCEPLITFANARKTYDAFMKIDFLVSANVFMTPSCYVSDIVLPVATINECDSVHTFTGTRPPHALPKITDPPGEAISDVMIINHLANRLGLGKYFFNSDIETLNYLMSPAKLTWEDLKKQRFIDWKTEEVQEEGGFFTTFSGKAELYSTRAKEAFNCNPLPVWSEVQPTHNVSAEYPLFMTSLADHEYRLSAWKEVKNFRKHKPYPTVQIHPDVAQKIGANDGDWIWIEGKLGRIMQRLVIDPDIDPRVVMATFGWYFPEDPANACQYDKANVNILIPDEPAETSSGAVDTRGVPCRVYKAKESEVNLPPIDFVEGTPIIAAGRKTWD